MAERITGQVGFFSFGSNDLTQMTMGFSRNGRRRDAAATDCDRVRARRARNPPVTGGCIQPP